MKATLVLLALACTLAVVYGNQVCGPHYCDDHVCSNPVAKSSCPSGTVYRAKHAGKCACCPACVTLLSVGAACKTYNKELGETPSAICKERLVCFRGRCTPAQVCVKGICRAVKPT